MSGPAYDRPPTPVAKKIFICSTQRTGSFLLCRAMIHQGLGVPHEYFNNVHSALIGPRAGIPALANGHLMGEDAAVRRDYIQALLDRRTVDGVFAAKIQWWEYARYLDNAEGRALLQDGHFIHLCRDDLLDQAISFHLSMETGRWGHDGAVTTRAPQMPRFFDGPLITARLKELADADAGWRQFFAVNRIEPLRLSYEALVQDVPGALRRIAEAFDLAGDREFAYAEEAPGHGSAPNEPTKADLKTWYVEAHRSVTQAVPAHPAGPDPGPSPPAILAPASAIRTGDPRVAVFCCGVQRGGVSSLSHHLRHHPSLSAPRREAPPFFDNEGETWRAPDYDRLHAEFDPRDAGRLRFEGAPDYSFWPPALARIRAYNPDARLIFLFRDPWDRAWSNWRTEYDRGAETMGFWQAIFEECERRAPADDLAPERRVWSYVQRSLYGKQVRRALDLFPREQLLFLKSEALRDEPEATLMRVADFLAIPAFPATSPISASAGNTSDLPEWMQPNVQWRELFRRMVYRDAQTFADLTGLDISDWPSCRADRFTA